MFDSLTQERPTPTGKRLCGNKKQEESKTVVWNEQTLPHTKTATMICRTSSTCIVLCAVLLSSLSSQCHAFTVSSQTKVTSRQQQRSLPVLAAESKDEKAVAVKSTLGKEITYDQESGRFFEKDGECIPDEEYCVLDKDSGEMIRLTLEEKERIFMDSLQVRWVLFWCCCDALFVSSLVVDLSDWRKIHINMASFLSSLFHPNTHKHTVLLHIGSSIAERR